MIDGLFFLSNRSVADPNYTIGPIRYQRSAALFEPPLADISQADWISSVHARIDAGAHVVVYIHGYAIDEADLLLSYYQYASALDGVYIGRPGVPPPVFIGLSWPSTLGSLEDGDYAKAQTNAGNCGPLLSALYNLLLPIPGVSRTIIAHSMGNQLLAASMSGFDPRAYANRLFMLAADVPDDLWNKSSKNYWLGSNLLSLSCPIVVWSSTNDAVLSWSGTYNGDTRLGYGGPTVTPPVVSAKDVSSIADTTRAARCVPYNYYTSWVVGEGALVHSCYRFDVPFVFVVAALISIGNLDEIGHEHAHHVPAWAR